MKRTRKNIYPSVIRRLEKNILNKKEESFENVLQEFFCSWYIECFLFVLFLPTAFRWKCVQAKILVECTTKRYNEGKTILAIIF